MLLAEQRLMDRKVALKDELFSEEEGSREAFKVLAKIAEVDVALRYIQLYDYDYEEEVDKYSARLAYERAFKKLNALKAFVASL